MIIKKLEIHGFKSFPDRTKIIFHPGITAIVGPNGTGKSNIIDAILWVLGGQRQKALRGEKTEDIIFNGNNNRPALSLAEVIMTLEEGPEELVISHRLFRSGESEYRLNGKPVRLRDIQETLWKREVAEKDYYIIEQGSIGLLLTSKPQEKRQLLEEAAGTAFYKEKKKQAQHKLEDTEQNLTRLEDIIAEVARTKNSLARQAAAARRYRQLREKIRQLRSLLFLKKLNQLEEKKQEIFLAYQASLDLENQCLAKIKAAEKEISFIRQKLWTTGPQLDQVREELHSLEKYRQKLEATKETKKLEFLEERKKQALEEIRQLEEEKNVLDQELTLLKTVETELEENLREKHQMFNQVKRDWEESDQRRRQMTIQLQQLRDNHLQKVANLTEKKNMLSRWEKEFELSWKQENKLITQKEKAAQQLQSIKDKMDKMRTQIEAIQKEKKLVENEIEKTQQEIELLKKELDKTRVEEREKLKRKEALIYEIETLNKIREKSTSQLGFELPGSWGRLLDLLSAEPGFGHLLDVFLGEATQATVIPAETLLSEELPEIKGLIFVLPSSREKIKPEWPDHPEIIGWLKDNLHPHGLLASRWSEFPDALVVQNLKTAIDLWLKYPELNFVTLKGEILLANGLLRAPKRANGLFALKEEEQKRHQELLKIEEELKPLEAKIMELTKNVKQMETFIEEKRQRETILETKLKEMDREIARLRMEEDQLIQNHNLFENELEFLLQEKKRIETELNLFKIQINSLVEEEIFIRDKITALEKILEEEEQKFNFQTHQVMELKAQVEIEETKRNHLRRQIEALEQRKSHLAQKIQTLTTQVESLEKEEKEVRQTLKALAEEIKSISSKIEKKQEEVTILENQYHQLRQEDELKEKEMAELRIAYENQKDERMKHEIARTQVERDLANLAENCWQELRKTLEELKADSPQKEMFSGEIEAELAKAEEELQKFKAVNLMAEEEYQQQKERYNFLLAQRNDLRESIEATKKAIDKIDEESKKQFLQALDRVNRHFQDVFTFLFRGGVAEIRLTNPENPLESGAEIFAQPPGKKLQNISLLSGGEKSLTSLAFLFALFRTRPTPFCILDEVDAALDENNISRFLDLMQEMKETTQFIIVTHNYKTMEVADYIYGTTMEEPNVTRLYSVRLEKKQEVPTLS
ncbi:MAG: chromosome segregation protein SMC [Candidatus Aminicenantes bacterium]|nr:chromosome segregation protein SMC [Candidatus Aminicenantes bacterium]